MPTMSVESARGKRARERVQRKDAADAAAAEAARVADLLSHAVRLVPQILLCATTHDSTQWSGQGYLKLISVCARVCPQWWHIVRRSAAYGAGLPTHQLPDRFNRHEEPVAVGRDERNRVLREIDRAMGRREVTLFDAKLGEEGGRALGAALQASSTPLAFATLWISGCDLTATGFAPIAAAVARGFANYPPMDYHWARTVQPETGLVFLRLGENPGLGNAGLRALAGVLPATLICLYVDDTGCGEAGMMALAASLPPLKRLRDLDCSQNPAVGEAGWASFASVLPELPSLREVRARDNPGMGSAGALALAAALPRCDREVLYELNVRANDIGDEAIAILTAAWGACGGSRLNPHGVMHPGMGLGVR